MVDVTSQEAPEETSTINVVPSDAIPLPPVNPQLARDKANLINLGTPQLGKNNDELYANLIAGREKQLRDEAASVMDLQASMRRQQLITEITRQTGKELPPEARDAILTAASKVQKTNPNTVFEENYAKLFVNALDASGALEPAKAVAPAEIQQSVDTAVGLKAKREIAHSIWEKAEAAYKSQSWGGWAVDMGKFLIPTYNEWNLRGHVKDVSFWKGLLGQNLEDQIVRLYQLPTDQFEARANEIVKNLLTGVAGGNPALAVSFASALVGQSTTERFLNNFFTPLDVSGLGGVARIGKAILGKSAAHIQADQMLKSQLRSDAVASKEAISDSIGDIKTAGAQRMADKVTKGVANPVEAELKDISSIFTGPLKAVEENPGILSKNVVNRIKEQANAVADKLVDRLLEAQKINRLPELAEAEFKQIASESQKNYRGLANNILDSTAYQQEKTNKLLVDHVFGQTGTELWTSKNAANKFNTDFLGGAATRFDQGGKYGLKITVPADETTPIVRNIIRTKGPDTPVNGIVAYLGKYISPEASLHAEQLYARKIATYGPSNLIKLAKEQSKEIDKLHGFPGLPKRARWNQFQTVLDNAQRVIDPATGEAGKFLNPVEINNIALNKIGRSLSEQEISAYYASRRYHAIYEVLNNFRANIDMTRKGIQKHTISVLDPAKETEKTIGSTPISFNAKRIEQIPSGDRSVLVMGEKLGEEEVRAARNVRKFFKEEQGYQIFKVSDAADKPFKVLGKHGDQVIDYVIAKNVKSESLPWRLVKGSIPEYDYAYKVSQAIVEHDPVAKIYNYLRDRNIATFSSRAQAEDWSRHINAIKDLMKAGDDRGAMAYLETHPIGLDWDKVKPWFKGESYVDFEGGKAVGKVVNPVLSLDHSVKVVPRHRMTIEMDNELHQKYGGDKKVSKLIDRTRENEGRSAHLRDRDFEDVFAVDAKGTVDNPLYNVSPAKLVDPFVNINRSISRAINSVWMDDYKIFSVEHWMQEAVKRGALKGTENELSANPFYHFHHPVYKEGLDPTVQKQMELTRLQIQQFLGVYDKEATFLHSVSQKLADSVFQGGSRIPIVGSWLLPKLRDPSSFLRSITFHAAIGLWNPAQLLVQMNTFANIWGIAGPKYASAGTKAFALHTVSRFNSTPEILNALDKIASTKLIPGTQTFKPGQFKEAKQILESTGFQNVGAEISYRDNIQRYNFIGPPGKEVLNSMSWFFNEGERSTRTAAFYTAYLEHRAVDAVGKVTDADVRKILQRADLLTTNMSRASSSLLQQAGTAALPLQFYTWQQRLAEQFLGKSLTVGEKARLFATYGTLYGFPMAFGLSGLPVGDFVKKWATDNGYNPGEKNNGFIDLAMNGLGQQLLALATGRQWNFSERYGAQGFTFLRDAMRGDNKFFDIIGGAAGQKLGATLSAVSGIGRVLMSQMTETDPIKLTREDMLKPLEGVGTFSAGKKALIAANTGKFLSQNETLLAKDATPFESVMGFLTGLSPEDASQAATMQWTLNDEKELKHWGEKEAIKEYRRSIREYDNDNPEQAKEYEKRALRILEVSGYPLEERHKVLGMAMKGIDKTILERTEEKFSKDALEPRPFSLTTRNRDTAREQFERRIRNQP